MNDFVAGLGDRITLVKLSAIFGRAGRLRNVFIQFKKKFQRSLRFGFVRFQSDDEAWTAIQMFNGLRLEGNYLVVQKARFQKSARSTKVSSPNRHQFEIQGKVWRPKALSKQNTTVKVRTKENDESAQLQEPAGKLAACQLCFTAADLDESWFQRCAQARTLTTKPVDVIQDDLAKIGLYNFCLIPLGANEVLLEFENKEEMLETISECGNFLARELSDVKPSTILTFGTAHLVWVRLWQVPLGLWTDSFFTAMGNRMGSFVETDADSFFIVNGFQYNLTY